MERHFKNVFLKPLLCVHLSLPPYLTLCCAVLCDAAEPLEGFKHVGVFTPSLVPCGWICTGAAHSHQETQMNAKFTSQAGRLKLSAIRVTSAEGSHILSLGCSSGPCSLESSRPVFFHFFPAVPRNWPAWPGIFVCSLGMQPLSAASACLPS